MTYLHKTHEVLHNVNSFLERIIPVTTPLGVVFGFLFPEFFIRLRPFVPLLFGIITFSGALKLTVSEFGRTIRRPSPILLFFLCAHVIMPLAAMLVSSLFFENQDIVAGFVLLFSGPTAISCFIWVSILKGDMALCLTLILLDTILAPLVVPGSVSILMGAKIAMNISGIAFSLLLMIVVPTIIGVFANEATRSKLPDVLCPWLNPIAKICLILVIAANAAAVAPRIRFDDPIVWKAAVFVILLTVAGFLLIKLITVIVKCRYPKDITVIVSGGLRNNSAVMTIAVTFFPEAAVIPTLLCLVFQQSITAVIGKIFTRSSG
ncbi:MAG: bile acid:sodium symporter family protein [Treponema sp.]|jgi:predicted Na+-dependent transporter|nr:bile acid:sodium symporter family protein [Treponema sp.]